MGPPTLDADFPPTTLCSLMESSGIPEGPPDPLGSFRGPSSIQFLYVNCSWSLYSEYWFSFPMIPEGPLMTPWIALGGPLSIQLLLILIFRGPTYSEYWFSSYFVFSNGVFVSPGLLLPLKKITSCVSRHQYYSISSFIVIFSRNITKNREKARQRDKSIVTSFWIMCWHF